MNSKKNYKAWYYDFKYANIAIFVISSLFLLIYWGSQQYFKEIANSFFILLTKEAGVAGYIAFALNMTAEWVNAKRHHEKEATLIKAMNEELFLAVYGRSMDKAIVNHIDKYILKSPVVRRNCEWAVTLKYENQQATLIVSNTYKIHNVTLEEQSYELKSIIDCMTDANDSDFTSVSINNEPIILNSEYVKNTEDKRFRVFSKVILIKPGIENSVNISLAYSRTVPARSSETIVAPCPMDSIKLTVLDQNKCFNVNAASIHPQDETFNNNGAFGAKEWRIDDAILPGQGILLMWELVNQTKPKRTSLPRKNNTHTKGKQ